ncbi:DUF4371 domain-containing protein, partial [Vibrio vulnificus]|uniref:DUF4371 domain-containing protein n=1 Tax=Vibrio vulnificus TaxID=672 RepID=UPI0019D44095
AAQASQTQYFGFKDQRQSITHNLLSGKAKIDKAYETRLNGSVDVSRLLLKNDLSFCGNDES